MTAVDPQVAARVAEQIRENGVTVKWLCERTGIPRTTFDRRLSAHRSFTLNELERVADALRIDIAVFLRDLTGHAA